MELSTDSTDAIVARRTGELLETVVDNELIGLHIDNGYCYGFNASATRIWALLEAPRSIGDLCQELTAEFDVSADQCRTDVLAVLRKLERDRLVALDRPA